MATSWIFFEDSQMDAPGNQKTIKNHYHLGNLTAMPNWWQCLEQQNPCCRDLSLGLAHLYPTTCQSLDHFITNPCSLTRARCNGGILNLAGWMPKGWKMPLRLVKGNDYTPVNQHSKTKWTLWRCIFLFSMVVVIFHCYVSLPEGMV